MEALVTRHGIARLQGAEIVVVDLPHPDLSALLADEGSLDAVAKAPVLKRIEAGALDEIVIPPLAFRTTSAWGIGLNYYAKAATTGRPVPTSPILFLKPSSSLAAHGAVLPIPALTSQFDYEAEVGIVVGRPLANARPEDVWDAVAGVIAGNDVTARDVMKETGTPTLAKGFPGCAPLGPTVLPVADLADRDAIPVASWVDGELRQQSTTADLIFDVPDLLARLSRYARLEPGDVVLTGTPPGTGQDRNDFLRAGQQVKIAVGDLVPLVNEFSSTG
jgi:2-keto-4-pentenoate hydratase/2-oxohepta-3-ene-1,7-dioic acid hydratase in catechol pathway